MEFLDIPIFDDDFFKMIFRFAINIIFLTIIIWFLYYKTSRRRDYLFTYYMIGIIVFFLCFTLKKYELDIGMALGLFAIFGIIRYRTNPIEIKEMTYLFIIIGVSVINSLANQKMSYSEILAANILIVASISLIQHLKIFQEIGKAEFSKQIVYGNLENLKPERYEILKEDIEKQTGLKINKITFTKVDLINNTTILKIFYNEENNFQQQEQ